MTQPKIRPDEVKVVEPFREAPRKPRPTPQHVTPGEVVQRPFNMVPITRVISPRPLHSGGGRGRNVGFLERAISDSLADGDDNSSARRANEGAKNMKLYHFTSKDAALDILHSGFKPGPDGDGTVWFAEHPTIIWGNESSEVLLEIAVPVGIVTPHKRLVELGDEDPASGEFVLSAEVEMGPYFALPPEVANRYKLRRVPDEERRQMMI